MKPRALFAAAILALIICLSLAADAGAQHVWTDSLAISTAKVDSMFRYPWKQLRLMPDGCDVLLKIGAPDTSSWRLRKYILVPDGETFVFSGGNFVLRRLAWKSPSGAGVLYFSGIKSTARY